MSESTIAKWNSIPLSREDNPNALKRPREEPENGEDDDDDISLVSRSPSPSPDAMDVDGDDHISKYDEYVRKPEREIITVNTKIKPTNKGFAMLAKMGWSEGQPVGLSGDGRIDPVPFELKYDSSGLGKTSQDVRMIEETVSQRRGLDSERQTKETEEQRRAREDAVARKIAVQDEIANSLRAFYCALCDKQFKTVAQYDEHTNSYAHHHKARLRDMEANARPKAQEEIDKRKAKERKREERELRKIAAAAGIKMPKSAAAPGILASGSASAALGSTAAISSAAAESADSVVKMNIDSQGAVQKKGGWSTIGPSGGTASVSSGFRKPAWAPVSSASSAAASSTLTPTQPPKSSGGWASIGTSSRPTAASQSPSPSPSNSFLSGGHTPAFRTGGWTSLETSASNFSFPPTFAPAPAPASPPPPPPAIAPPLPPSNIDPASIRLPPSPPPPLPPSSFSAATTNLQPAPLQPPPPPPPEPQQPSHPSSRHLQAPVPQPAQPVARSGWQKFQQKHSKRK